ncbi:ADP-ribosylation factor-like protein 6-interacting protein 6 isoform X2 [Phycodurus eques]|uniref:ADP-ribosylation factor-like protein 6-interacting protein 6 isoform X2 n=1 Tax=Phycodurus eques TaxID=693459 RepID=UPI002ACECDBD|nr:ADP-ribosylation factor-like protein 6-interacting protein 6 isoform X2 [Phycodurus eques]
MSRIEWDVCKKKNMEHISHTGAVLGGSSVKRLNNGFKPLTVMALSVVVSAVVVLAVGAFYALLDPILQELRAGRVKEEDGAEVRMLGLSCCVFSWTLTYLNYYKPGLVPPTLLTLLCSDKHERDFLLDYGVALLNGTMATFTVIWNLT